MKEGINEVLNRYIIDSCTYLEKVLDRDKNSVLNDFEKAQQNKTRLDRIVSARRDEWISLTSKMNQLKASLVNELTDRIESEILWEVGRPNTELYDLVASFLALSDDLSTLDTAHKAIQIEKLQRELEDELNQLYNTLVETKTHALLRQHKATIKKELREFFDPTE